MLDIATISEYAKRHEISFEEASNQLQHAEAITYTNSEDYEGEELCLNMAVFGFRTAVHVKKQIVDRVLDELEAENYSVSEYTELYDDFLTEVTHATKIIETANDNEDKVFYGTLLMIDGETISVHKHNYEEFLDFYKERSTLLSCLALLAKKTKSIHILEEAA